MKNECKDIEILTSFEHQMLRVKIVLFPGRRGIPP
jgi:hypothetical protein